MAKVLIIDDDPDIVDSLTMILEANGYDVAAKHDADNLVAEVEDINPDLIILDVIFPEDPQAGFKAARTLSKHQNLAHIPVLILSAVNVKSKLSFGISDSDISEDFMPVGAFLDKPVEPKVLVAKIEALLRPRGGAV